MGGGLVEPSRFADGPFKLRAATKADLDAIFQVVKAGFPDDPGCEYKFPYRDKYPDDFRKWTRLEYKAYIDQPAKFATLVVTTPIEDDDDTIDTPIAIGVWDMAVETKAVGGDHGIDERRDANPEHMKAYAKTMTASFGKHFAKYGQKQVHLWMLMTHPDFRRRGAGTMLCNWGLEEATAKAGYILTLMASPMGKKLYEHLGYKKVGTETVRVDKEEEVVKIFSMEKKIPRSEA